MSAALFLVVIFRSLFLLQKEPASFLRNPKVWAVVAIYAISLAGWFAFFYAIWGNAAADGAVRIAWSRPRR